MHNTLGAFVFSVLALMTTAPLAGPAETPGKAAQPAGVVIVTSGGIKVLSREEAAQLFLGQRTTLRDGTPVTLIDLPAGPARNHFYRELTGKNPVQVRANWSRLVFSGRVRPPREAASQSEALELLARTPNAIGYLPADAGDKRLKVLLSLSEN
ncbi:MAG: hypothetical protein LBE06_06730 [Azoarcus sp.]|jgi:hypothetical protein|nr:hypothetical protein [Azoarcus sp.]